MRSGRKTEKLCRYTGAFSKLLIDNVNIFLAVEGKVREMAAQRDQTQVIQKFCDRLKEQLGVINRVCLSPQLSCLNPADQSACANRIATSLQQMGNLLVDINNLDDEIKKRDNSWREWFMDRFHVIGLITEPEWKRLHTNCITALGELQQDIDAINIISIQNILEKITELHAILSGAVTQMGGENRPRGNWHQASSLLNRAHRHSTSNPSGQNSIPEHHNSPPTSFCTSRNDSTQTTRRFDEEDLLRRVRDHSTHLWDGKANQVQIRGESGDINLNTSIQVVLLGPGPHGTAPSIALWDTDMKFWHFQVQQDLPFSSMPVTRTSRAARIMVIRHELSGVQTLEWVKEQKGYMKMQLVLSFPRVKDCRRICNTLGGYRILRKSRITARDSGGAENHGIVEVIDLKPLHRFVGGSLDPPVIGPNGAIRVLQMWCFERDNPWVVGESLIWLHVAKLSASYSLNRERKHILQIENATMVRNSEGITSLRSSSTVKEMSETGYFEVRFEKKKDAKRTLHLLTDFLRSNEPLTPI